MIELLHLRLCSKSASWPCSSTLSIDPLPIDLLDASVSQFLVLDYGTNDALKIGEVTEYRNFQPATKILHNSTASAVALPFAHTLSPEM